jgi:Tat protein secretion system quality control protein TatD with DNase activity/predicted alpha/beta hydrolase family esterase
MLIDTHAHLNFKAYDSGREAVIKRCQEKKMSVINVGAQFATSKFAVDLAKKQAFFYASVGLHPIHVFDEPFKQEDYQKLINDKVVAIGETGLDFWHLKFLEEPYKIVLLHGWGGNKDDRFFPWLDELLTKAGHQVIRFNLPNTYLPKQDKWLKEIKKQIGYVNQKTILIGFSLGGSASLRFLETLSDEKIGAAFLIATPYTHQANIPVINDFFREPFNWDNIKDASENFFIYGSDDDNFMDLDYLEELAKKLNGQFRSFKDLKHFEIKKLPELAEDLNFIISQLNQKLPTVQHIITKQQEIFLEHIQLAKKNNLALICHGRNGLENREVYEEMLEILIKQKMPRAVMHCYGYNIVTAKKIASHGYYIGIDGPVTFKKKAEEVQQMAKEIPLDKILIETDCPYLAPEPFRGQKNEPMYVEYVAAKIAELKNIDKEKVIEQTWQNARELFRLKS